MLKGLWVILSIAVVVIAAIIQPAFAGFDLGGMLEAGKDLTSAATLTDGQVKQLASEASRANDQSNQVAPSSSPYAQRLAKLTKGMKIDGNIKPDIKVYLVKDVNAFAMADGTIRVFAGLLDQMTDDEVRYVIGHEIGHVSLGHSKKAFPRPPMLRPRPARPGSPAAAAWSDCPMKPWENWPSNWCTHNIPRPMRMRPTVTPSNS